MGCIKSSGTIKIQVQNDEKKKQDEMEQNRVISTYVSSSQCGESESSIKSSHNSKSKNFEIEKESESESNKEKN